MARLNLPKFGNWDTEETVSYTTYFENARRVSSSEKKVNINNSFDTRNLISNQDALKDAESTMTKHEGMVNNQEERQRSVDGGNRGDSIPQEDIHTGVSTDAPAKKAARQGVGGFQSADNSPLHPCYQAKIGVKENAVSSPSWERKGLSEGTQAGLAPSTPGRSRLKSVTRGNETPERVASVPKFGQWDESDPSSADGFSYIFNRVKEERHGSGGNASSSGTDTQRSRAQKHYGSNYSKGCCCFPWGGN